MTLLLFVALLAIGATAAIERIDTQVKRDREEEMVHRGVQYSRAIRNFVKKFGRYPSSIEDLQSTNNLRFLRKRYKDPITGKDFKLLHMGDIQSITTPGLAGATPAASMSGATGQQGFGQSNPQSGFMQSGANGGLGAGNSTAGNSANGNSGQLALSGDLAGNNNPNSAQNSGGQNSGNQSQSTDQNGGDSSNSGMWNEKSSPGQTNGQVFGGGPIVGVASISKEKSIRVFNNKDHYNQWFFIYDPTTDRGGLITTPYQPGIGGTVMPGQMGMGMPGQTGMPGSPATTAAPNPGFGAPAGSPNSGFGNTGSSPQQPQQPQNPGMQNPATF